MQLANGKTCLECKVDLARFWGHSFCEKCFTQLLRENLAKEDALHAGDVD